MCMFDSPRKVAFGLTAMTIGLKNYVEKQPKKPLLIAVDTQTNETIIKDGIPLKVGR